jgi:signal transduction histidine kinase
MEKHVGLRVMRERVEEVGGSLSLKSAAGQGTKLVVRVPVKGANHA